MKILVGCPVRDRELVIDEYLDSIYSLDYPKNLISLYFLINDSIDSTEEKINDFIKKNGHLYNKAEIKSVWLGTPSDLRYNRHNINLYGILANLRNQFLSAIKDEDYVLSVDSDIIIKPDTLNKLLSFKVDIVAAQLPTSKMTINAMDKRYGKFINMDKIEGGLIEVESTGACILLSKKAAKIKYEYHPQGEDIGFCINAKKAGFKVYLDCSQFLNHKIIKKGFIYEYAGRHEGWK